MSKPQPKLTMFYTESNPVAVLVTTTGGDRKLKNVRHTDPQEALAWCREHQAAFIYTPIGFDADGQSGSDPASN